MCFALCRTHTITIAEDSDVVGAPENAPKKSDMQGWELRLVQEYCDEGSLRDKLNEQFFAKGTFPSGTCNYAILHINYPSLLAISLMLFMCLQPAVS
jgi:hypothetical protein